MPILGFSRPKVRVTAQHALQWRDVVPDRGDAATGGGEPSLGDSAKQMISFDPIFIWLALGVTNG